MSFVVRAGIVVAAFATGAMALAQDRFRLVGELPAGKARERAVPTAKRGEVHRGNVSLRSSTSLAPRFLDITDNGVIGLAVPRDGSSVFGAVGSASFTVRRDQAGYIQVTRPGFGWRTLVDSVEEENVDVTGGTTFSFGGEPLVQFPSEAPLSATLKNG